MEPEDSNLCQTALREAREEVGLRPESVEIIGQLSDVISRHEILVTPVVGLIPPGLAHQPDQNEIDRVFEVPVDFFRSRPARVDTLVYQNLSLRTPCWMFQGEEIWGMTAIVLHEFLVDICGITVEIA